MTLTHTLRERYRCRNRVRSSIIGTPAPREAAFRGLALPSLFTASDAYSVTYRSLAQQPPHWHATCFNTCINNRIWRLAAAVLSQEVLRMSFFFPVQKLFLASNQWGAQKNKKILCADKSFAAAFPGEVTKVALNVDTAGREVLLSGQEGICVQWR
jgi:hypothetical protein